MPSEEFPPKACPACGSVNIVYNEEDDELTCKDCGLIVPGASSQEELVDQEYKDDVEEE